MLRNIKAYAGTLLLFTLVVVLATTGHAEPVAPEHDLAFLVGQRKTVQGTITRIDRGIAYDRSVVHVQGYGSFLLYIPLRYQAAENNNVVVSCTFEKPEAFDDFRYDRWLALRDVYVICRKAQQLQVEPHERGAKTWLADFRETVIRQIQQTIPEPEAALASGLLFGGTHGMSEITKEQYRKTGTSHIVAASGYNVAIVAALVLNVLLWAGMHRKVALAGVFVSIVLYVVMAGFDSSLVRAGIMGSILLFVKHSGRKVVVINVVLFAAAAMLLQNPHIFWDDVGFQLSFLSVLGLLYIAPHLEKITSFIPNTFALRENIAATVSATIMTAPVVWLTFGKVAARGVWVNAAVLPFVPLAMLASSVVATLNFIGAPSWVGIMAWLPLRVITKVIQLSAF